MISTHTWNVSPKEAIQVQKDLKDKIKIGKFLNLEKIQYIAGADISLNRFSSDIFAGIILLSFPDLKPINYSIIKSKTDFPYIPGLLSFREVPALLDVWKKLKTKPDVLIVDGQGIAHPRRLGIATHLGFLLDIPTIGCAKSLLYGKYEEPAKTAGSFSYLYDKYNQEEKIGVVLRTKDNVKPVIISPGHKMDVEDALEIMKKCSGKYRIPEPTRLAHELVNQFRRGEL
jgi:deoxyribonuclease V